MSHIFRNIPDVINIHIPWWLHFIILFVFISGFVMIYIKRNSSYLAPIFIFLLIMHQILLYSWYLFSQYHTLTEGLPLYHCRLAILFLTIYYFTKSKIWAQLGVQIGLLGSMISLSVFVPDPFTFPHITQLTYVLGHAVLGWYAWLILLTNVPLFTRHNLYRNHFFILGINLILILFDYTFNANYGFFMMLPLFPPPESLILRQILLLLFFNGITYFLGYMYMKFQQKFIKKSEV